MNIWPVNYAEQLLFVEQMRDRAAALNKTRQPVVLNRLQTPTQAEWESAYVSQTGQPLPILPGTRLLWRDPNSGAMRCFTTAYDLDNGAASSGTIFSQISQTYEKGALRLLASARGNQGFRDVKFRPHNPPPPNYQQTDAQRYPIDLVLEMKRGLNSLIFIGSGPNSSALSVDLAVTNRFPDTLNSVNNIHSWINPLRPPFFAANLSNIITGEWRVAANTFSGGQLLALSQSWTAPFWVQMDLVAAPNSNGNMFQTAGAISVQGFSATFGVGGGGQHATRLTVIQSYIPLPQLHSLAVTFGGGMLANGETNKAFIYGLYENNDSSSGIA